VVFKTILKNDGVRKNGKDDIPYMMENKIHVPKHQSVMDSTWHPDWYMTHVSPDTAR
jgi:hypothetical protein